MVMAHVPLTVAIEARFAGREQWERAAASLRVLGAEARALATQQVRQLSESFRENLRAITPSIPALSRLERGMATVARTSRVNAEGLLTLARFSREAAAEAEGPLRTALLDVSSSLIDLAGNYRTALIPAQERARERLAELADTSVRAGLDFADFDAKVIRAGGTVVRFGEGARPTAAQLQALRKELFLAAEKTTVGRRATLEFAHALTPLIRDLEEAQISARTAAVQGLAPLSKQLDFAGAAALRMPAPIEALQRALERTTITSSRQAEQLLAMALQTRRAIGASSQYIGVIDRTIEGLRRLTTEIALQEEKERRLVGSRFQSIVHTERETAALNLSASAAHGAMLAMGALQGNILMVAFSTIFLRFSLVRVTLTFAALFFAVGGVFRLTRGLGRRIWEMAQREFPAFAEQLKLLASSATEAGRAIVKELFGPLVEPVFIPIIRGIRILIGWIAALIRSFLRVPFVQRAIREGSEALGLALRVLGRIFVAMLVPAVLTALSAFLVFQAAMYPLIRILGFLARSFLHLMETHRWLVWLIVGLVIPAFALLFVFIVTKLLLALRSLIRTTILSILTQQGLAYAILSRVLPVIKLITMAKLQWILAMFLTIRANQGLLAALRFLALEILGRLLPIIKGLMRSFILLGAIGAALSVGFYFLIRAFDRFSETTKVIIRVVLGLITVLFTLLFVKEVLTKGFIGLATGGAKVAAIYAMVAGVSGTALVASLGLSRALGEVGTGMAGVIAETEELTTEITKLTEEMQRLEQDSERVLEDLRKLERVEMPALAERQIRVVPIVRAQEGFFGILRRPTLFLAGERGPEIVYVGRPRAAAAMNIFVTVSGNYILDDRTARALGDRVSDALMRKLRNLRPVSVR